ncbi:hypothetical protein CDCA_CDCA01G0358 [Cyanidium caldarium]|uniref:Delta(14)-sterol reductase n=1 Tax=Cyanidium caldarium TaxID=2771 RepID=A0AAV9IQY4_CYACA|nr:hypothetical protein CDCA_CDCA01G0358 [Cyanidium caldarium]
MGALTYVSVVVSGLLWRDRGIALSSVHHSLSSLTCSSLFQAGLVLLAFITLLAVAGSALPGWVHPGTLLPDGKTRLYYKCNGLLLLVLSVVAWLLGDRYFGHEVGAWAAHHCGALFLAAQATAFTLATYLVVRARWLDQLRRRNWFRNRESSWLHDFILGAELNPHLLGGRLELKFFWLRPSMIGWCLLNLSIAAQQLAVHGRLSPRMLLYQVLADGYIVDYFWNEKRMTTTWDIVAEHFGLMLIWGDLVFIPFAFSLQAWCLLHDQRPLPSWHAAGILGVAALGGYLFRSANSQKDSFKRDPQRPVTRAWRWRRRTPGNRTFGEGRILASGWWGLARHMNYTGDLLLALSFSLPCIGGPGGAWAFFYFFYLLILLIHRSKRDDERCARKYGKSWAEYCRAVPQVFLPGIW